MPYRTFVPLLLASLILLPEFGHGDDRTFTLARSAPPKTRIVALGDSITKGVRTGVRAEETFEAVLERQFRSVGDHIEVLNMGIGGERTDQALGRLDSVISQHPRFVTIMYGTNDSYVDKGAQDSRISLDAYRSNLRQIVEKLLRAGIEPILMTEPRWADSAKNGIGENPNLRLEPYVQACRHIANECQIPLVDHFRHWTDARARGQSLMEWTTDGCHPNPAGHLELASIIRPILQEAIRPAPQHVKFTTKLDTILTHDDGKFLWYHPRAAAFPSPGQSNQKTVLITLQKHLQASDHYSNMSTLLSPDLGASWTGPTAVPALDWVRESPLVDIAVADVTPLYHPASGKVIAVGAQVRYSKTGEQLADKARSNQTAYAIYDPKVKSWTAWKRLEMPADPMFNLARSACSQFVVETDGSLLLPFYIGTSATVPYSVTVVRCRLDGESLIYQSHGDILKLNVERGVYEPSLIRHDNQYFLTLRNDLKGYVSRSNDGLHYRPIKAWTFDDGQELGSYNTQQHWLSHGEGLFLVYTRRGVGNDHIVRHRAPLFMAQVDSERLEVLRSTERVIVPERGAELGNFGASEIDATQSWVTVAEGLWDAESRKRGGKGAVFAARILWEDSTTHLALQRVRERLKTARDLKVACLGDSVTGVYYHTGSRRAYPEMIEVALQRAFPKSRVSVINAGISGNTTVDALKRLDRDVIAHKPDLVTVMFGLNDMTRVPLDAYKANLKEIAERCRKSGVEVLFCTSNHVITTSDRPVEKLEKYVAAMEDVAKANEIPLCDIYHEMKALQTRAARSWRLLLSDPIHPNMDGHRQMAESITQSISGRRIDLSSVEPLPAEFPGKLTNRKNSEPFRVLAMTPFDKVVEPVLRSLYPTAKIEVTAWETAGKTVVNLEREAQARVRSMKPDLVILAVPRSEIPVNFESFVHNRSWIMNWSLNFGQGGWDCLVIHPSVDKPNGEPESDRDDLIRQLVRAQDLHLIDRSTGDSRPGAEIVKEWLTRAAQNPK